MKRRYFDRRVGWFARSQVDYGLEAQESKSVTYLDRWRLEVKEEDREKFRQGELVEPKKPITTISTEQRQRNGVLTSNRESKTGKSPLKLLVLRMQSLPKTRQA